MAQKGKPRPYDYFEPKHTKSGRLTKDSQRKLDAINRQKLAEQAADTDFDKVTDAVAFMALVTFIKGGIDVFQYLMDKLNPIPGVTDAAGDIWSNTIAIVGRLIGKTEVTDPESGETEIVDVKFDTWLSEDEVQKLVDESLKEYIKELGIELATWINIKHALEAETFTSALVLQRDGVQVLLDQNEQALITLIDNEPTQEDCE